MANESGTAATAATGTAGAGDAGGGTGAGAGTGTGAAGTTGTGTAAGTGTGTGGAGTGAGAGTGGAGGTAAGVGGGAGGDGGKTYWPNDWREHYAGADEKKLGVLKRFASPEAAFDSYLAAQAKLTSGELKSAKPANATPEQLVEWRKANGIPDKPAGYLDGVKIEEWDKPAFESFAEAMHGLDLPPAAVQAAFKWRDAWQEKQIETRVAADESLRVATEDNLRAEWGREYTPQINHIHSFLTATAPQDVQDLILDARSPDGNPLVGSPAVVRWLAQLSREWMPMGSIPGAGDAGNIGHNVEERIGQIEKMMRTDRDGYNRDEKVQAELRDLYRARERVQQRGGRAA